MMLELLVQFPGKALESHSYTAAPVSESDLLIRGFNSDTLGFKRHESLLPQKFWTGFGTQKLEHWENKDSKTYGSAVERVIQYIQQQQASKVVLSRTHFMESDRVLAQESFEALCAEFPNCTVFAFHHDHFGAWMGATPEVLLEETDEGYRSMSLAGTRLAGGLTWGDKEIEEQKFVTKEIHRTLKEMGGHIKRTPQTTFGAGPVEHLMTWVNTDNRNLAVIDTLEALHPTPAVCGTPTVEALKILQEIESYPRELYTGYIAWLDGPIYANVMLRTMKWYKNGIQFFAGGGITKDSVPLNEWMETEYKISALKDAVKYR